MKNIRATLCCKKAVPPTFLLKRIKNDGEITQYYIQQNHEPIISQEMFSLVSKEHSRRSRERMAGSRYTNSGEFFGRTRCGVCGGRISIRRRHPNTKYEKIVYQCTCRYKKNIRCQSEIFKAEHIYALFEKALLQHGYSDEQDNKKLSEIWKEKIFNATLYSKSRADFEFFDGTKESVTLLN